MEQEIRDTAFSSNDEIYNKKIKAVPVPEKEIGIDLKNNLLYNLIDAVQASQFDVNSLNSFTNVSRTRNQLYDTLDYMAEDTTLASVLETYAEDATETNDTGRIVWCESDDGNAAQFVTYLLDALNVDKNVFQWAHSLCKYGDVYLRLYRESEYNKELFKKDKVQDNRESLNEDLVIKAYSKNDNYVHYIEMIKNPAEVFELTRFGKTAAYIKTNVPATLQTSDNPNSTYSFLNKYSFNKNDSDIELYQPTEFVHGCLNGNSSRIIEEVQLFVDPESEESYTYQVKRGQSILQNSYKVWRQLMLLENSVLLNRVTQSSIVRVIGVEVGDQPKENVQFQLMNIKNLIEQKAALDVGKNMNEYTNPGPIANNIYVPTTNGKGVISTQQIGGDVNIGELVDLDYYNDKLFGGLRVPKQYFGKTDDSAGFSGGQSLSIISSRYAKMIKHIQNVLIQMITDAINIICIQTNNHSYINAFTIRMLAPTTQEEVDRRDNLSNQVGLVSDILNTLADVQNPATKMKITKNLLSNIIGNPELLQFIQDEIDELEAQAIEEKSPTQTESSDDFSEFSTGGGYYPSDSSMDFESGSDFDAANDVEVPDETNTEEVATAEDEDDNLPSPEELGIGDVSDSNNPELT